MCMIMDCYSSFPFKPRPIPEYHHAKIAPQGHLAVGIANSAEEKKRKSCQKERYIPVPSINK